MTVAAALAAHAHLLPPRPSPSTSPKVALPTIAEVAQESSGELDANVSSPSIASTPSLGSSRNASFDSQSFPASPVSAHSPLAESVSSALSVASGVRRNEYLAVLIPKHLWKPDSQASRCDTFHCRRKFSLFERKHHCRKCGGIFCSQCSTRATQLLDTAQLDFLLPPRNVPITAYESPQSPVLTVRVCDDCYVQIHGVDVTSPPASVSSMSRIDVIDSSSHSASSDPGQKRPRRRSSGHKSRQSHSSRTSSSPSSSPSLPSQEMSLGDLDYYPLRHHSSICKATGGGRWEPKPIRNWDGHRVPGGKAPFEVALELKEKREAQRRLNPIYRHGEFQLRAPRPPEPIEQQRKSFDVATF